MEPLKRRSKRAPHFVEVEYEGGGSRANARISDISAHGVFVDTLSSAAQGEVLRMAFNLPSGERVHAEGRVKYVQQNVGMGIEFIRLEAGVVRRIAELVESTT